MNTGKRASNQDGMVLLLCMIFLTAMMLLGLSASADTILQNQLAANLQKAEQTRQSAQTALEAAEKWIMDLDAPVTGDCTTPCDHPVIYSEGELPADLQYKPLDWWLANGQARVQNLGKPSVWLIESSYSIASASNPDEKRSWYRIFARASDSTDTVVSVVESIVLKTWPVKEETAPTVSSDQASCTAGSGDCRRLAWRRLR